MLKHNLDKPLIESIYSRIFCYRQRENNSPLENFITEIFGYCLESDSVFRKDFFKGILKMDEPLGEPEIITQCAYDGCGRPDLEINYASDNFLIESKIEASERKNQLADYVLILKKFKPTASNKHIVFLTKYYEHRDWYDSDINLHMVRWFQIFELITEKHSQITNQLKLFLKEQNMEKVKNFTIQDMLAMKTIPETITKMDELLEQFKSEFDKNFGGFSKDSSRSTRLPYSLYVNYVQLSYDNAPYHILIGFFWWWKESEIPYVGLSIEVPVKKFKNSELVRVLDSEIFEKSSWEFEDNGRFYNYSSLKPLSEFITVQEDNLPAMKKFIQSQLQTLYDVRKRIPKMFTK